MEEWLERERNGDLMEGKEKEKAKGAGLKRSSERDVAVWTPTTPRSHKRNMAHFLHQPSQSLEIGLM